MSNGRRAATGVRSDSSFNPIRKCFTLFPEHCAERGVNRRMAIETCARCGAKNRVDEMAAGRHLRPVCGRCGAALGTGSSGASADAGAAPDTGRTRVVTDAVFARDVLDASGARPVLLDCWAPWCGPCRMVAPLLDQLAAESGGRYVIAKLNVDENPQTAARFQIQSIPTLLIFKQGKMVDRIVGAQPKHIIAARLAAHV